MRTSAKLALTALIAALLLASVLSTASAGRLSFNTQNIRTTWSRIEFQTAVVTVRCPVTLEGSFHSRTFPKIERLLIGAVTRLVIKGESCTNGSAVARALPWHLTYDSFAGTLPDITSVRLLIERFVFEIITLGRTCKYGTAADNVVYSAGINGERLVTQLTPAPPRNVAHLLEGPVVFPGCPSAGELVTEASDGQTRILNTGGFIKLTLI